MKFFLCHGLVEAKNDAGHQIAQIKACPADNDLPIFQPADLKNVPHQIGKLNRRKAYFFHVFKAFLFREHAALQDCDVVVDD